MKRRLNGKQHIETFERKKEADARHAQIKVEIKQGTHVAPSTSINSGKGGKVVAHGL
jgi:hypothetical protein